MKIIKFAQQEIDNPIYAKLATECDVVDYNNDIALPKDTIVVFDAKGSNSDDLTEAVNLLCDTSSILLLNASQQDKEATKNKIGFCSDDTAQAYFVSQTMAENNHYYYRIFEIKEAIAQIETTVASRKKSDKEAHKDKPESCPIDTHTATSDIEMTLSKSQIDSFIDMIKHPKPQFSTSSTQDAPLPADLVQYVWDYSIPYSDPVSGSESHGMQPESSTITLTNNLVFTASLNDSTQTPAFQYINVYLNGILSNGGMKESNNDAGGWLLVNMQPEIQVDANLLTWSASSPATANDVTQVTTGSSYTVGFDAGTGGVGANGSYTYDNSETENITDWYINQAAASQWIYAQTAPYDGMADTDDKFKGGFQWFDGTVQHSDFTAISVSSLQYAVTATFKTQAVSTSTTCITVVSSYEADYLMSDAFHEVIWQATPSHATGYQVDLSVVSQDPNQS